MTQVWRVIWNFIPVSNVVYLPRKKCLDQDSLIVIRIVIFSYCEYSLIVIFVFLWPCFPYAKLKIDFSFLLLDINLFDFLVQACMIRLSSDFNSEQDPTEINVDFVSRVTISQFNLNSIYILIGLATCILLCHLARCRVMSPFTFVTTVSCFLLVISPM